MKDPNTSPPVWMVLSRRAGIGGRQGLLKGWSLGSSSPFPGSGVAVGIEVSKVSKIGGPCGLEIARA